MLKVTFPDGAQRIYDHPITGIEIALSIHKNLARDAVAIQIEGKLYDLTQVWDRDISCRLITRNEEEGLEILRHDGAHVLAEAVKELYPETQVTIGPAIENGFYYDFHRQAPFTLDDFGAIEARMKEIVDRDEPITREEWSRDQAISFFRDLGETFKAELTESIPPGETISVYRQGNFVDLCRGPHLPSTGRLGKAFKLMKLAGAYWRGDARGPVLQRIYGTVWASEKDLKDYLLRLEEAEKRDHRRIGKEMDLFHFQEEAMGSVFWHARGWTLYRTLVNYMREKIHQEGYQEVQTPQLVDRQLWEASGHWDKFRESMLTCETEDQRVYALKPMNCPCHVQIFRQGIKSYRDLPLRMAEFGSCMRYEPSGALMGLMRVRSFAQDDAHIFCTEDQISQETASFCRLLLEVYQEMGFSDVSVRFSDRPERRAGDDTVWDKAELALKEGAEAAGLTYTLNPGEGAFYGPKLEFVLKDALGRSWQCGTLQVDFVLPERLDANYVAEDGKRHRPVMLHRAIFGSLERFIGVLIEHYAGKFPLWLAPVQVAVATITQESNPYALDVVKALKHAGLRVEHDIRNEKISYKIRELSLQKIPYIFVIGKKEAEEQKVTIRRLGTELQEVLALPSAIDKLQSEVASLSSF